jgi:hypothetical protein
MWFAFEREIWHQIFFDMRGFWPMKRRTDPGIWPIPYSNRCINITKERKPVICNQPTRSFALTEAGEMEMKKWPSYNPQSSISVIPVVRIWINFSLTNQDQKREGRKGWDE